MPASIPKLILELESLTARRSTFCAWTFRKFGRIPRLFRELEINAQPGDITALAPLLFSTSAEHRLRLANLVSGLLLRLAPEEYPALDERIRRSTTYRNPLPLETLRTLDFSEYGQFAWIPLCIASCCADGRVRERAVRLLREQSEPTVIPFLLLRANDWVKQVRQAAEENLKQHLVPASAPALLTNLTLIKRLTLGRAAGQSEIHASFDEFIRKPECSDALTQARRTASLRVRRICYEMALEGPIQYSLLENGLQDPDALIQLICLRAAAQLGESNERRTLVYKAATSAHPSVRRAAIVASATFVFADVQSLIRTALLDQSRVVRESAQKVLRHFEAAATDAYLVNIYLHALSSNEHRVVVAALREIARLGQRSTCERVLPYSRHQSARIRRAAVYALHKLDVEGHRELFFELLEKDSIDVAIEASRAIASLKTPPSKELLVSLLEKVGTSTNGSCVLALINTLPKWERVTALLQVASQPKHSQLAVCEFYLKSWIANFNKGSTSAPSETLAVARKSLAQARTRLDPRLASSLEFYLKDL